MRIFIKAIADLFWSKEELYLINFFFIKIAFTFKFLNLLESLFPVTWQL